ncbi:DUF255 domain-containing protein [Rubripirellula sp.]|nr:DUF255 domain-containing protein [Rubripirellula sp.]
MRHLIRLTTACLLLVLAGSAQADVKWYVQLQKAHAAASKEGKPLLLHFYADRCVWCEKLEKGAFASPVVEDAIHADFIPVKVHANTSPSLAKMFKVDKFPSDVIVTTTGKTISHAVSPQDVTRYVEMLQNAIVTLQDARNEENTSTVNHAALTNQLEEQVLINEHAATAGKGTIQAADQSDHSLLATGSNSDPKHPSTGLLENADASKTGKAKEIPPPTYATLEKPLIESSDADSNDTVITSTDKFTPDASSPPATPENSSPAENSSTPESTEPQQTQTDIAPKHGVVADAESLHSPNALSVSVASNHAASSDSSPELALEGYCAVTVIKEDQWVEGDPLLSVIHLGRLYLFSSEANREEFLADPTPFTPVLNEIDPVVFFEERRIVPGKREWGMKDPIHQRMFFFADEASMNHFYQQYERYAQSAIDLMDRAIKVSNPGI